MTEELFDLSEEYQSMLNQGIRLSGESMASFLEGRLNLLQTSLTGREQITRILDFGCGLGHASKRLAEMFSGAEIIGADTSERALDSAQQHNGGLGIHFIPVRELAGGAGGFDLCYVNGVFHHIPLEERAEALHLIHRNLCPSGRLALFENNPWNPGARMVMARIPFDREARMLSLPETSSLLSRTGFDIVTTGSLFFFPRVLKALRFAEPFLGWTHLGAQYMVLGQRR